MHPGCLISLTRLSPMESVIMVLSIVFIQAPVSQRSKLLGRHNQKFLIPNLTQCFRKSTIFKYLSCNYLYLSCIKCLVILLIFILLSHTCIALKALISYLHTHTVHTLYYYMFSFHSVSYSLHVLAMEPHAFYIKCNYIKISNMSLLYIQLPISNISYPNIPKKSTRCVLSMTLFSAYNFMRSCIQIISINKCNVLIVLNSCSTISGERILIVTHTRVAYCVCIHISQCPVILVNIILYVYYIHVCSYNCKSFFYSCDINIKCNVHVQARYLISCVSRIEALSPISIYSSKIIALDISGQYVIKISIRRINFIAILSQVHVYTPKKFSTVFLVNNVRNSLIIILHPLHLWFNYCTIFLAIHSIVTLVNYFVFSTPSGHPHATALFELNCFVFSNLNIHDGS